MTDRPSSPPTSAPAPVSPGVLPVPRRRQGGFTLLEIMIALAILAVGSMCVLSTFAAALALHMRRESDVRVARVMQEATFEAETIWNGFDPRPGRALPESIPLKSWSRDPGVLYTIVFHPVDGLPSEGGAARGGVRAVVTISEEGSQAKPREESVVLSRTGINPDDLATSVTFDEEKKADTMEKNDPYGRKRDR